LAFPSRKKRRIKAPLQSVKPVGAAVAALLLALSLFHFVHGVYGAGRYGFVDFPIFLAQAREFLLDGELYVDAADPENYAPAAAVYKFPPLYAMLLLPLVRDGIEDGVYWGHWALQILLYAGAVATLLGLYGRRAGAAFFIIALCLALNFEPFFETLWRLQIETPLLFLLTLALLLSLARRDAWSGVAVGLGAMLKLYPAFMLLHFAIRRRWVVLGWFAVTSGLVLVSALIVIGVEECSAYFFRILPLISREAPSTTSENLSFGRYLQQWGGAGPQLAKRAGQAIVLAMVVLSLVAVHRSRRDESDREHAAVCFALFVPLMLLALPNSWVNYQLLLLLPFVVLLHHCLTAERKPALLAVALVVSYLPTLFYWPCEQASVPWPCAQTPRFLGLWQLPRTLHDFMVDLRLLSTLILWVALLYVVTRRPGSARGGAADDLAGGVAS
jgi:hypothetical protein